MILRKSVRSQMRLRSVCGNGALSQERSDQVGVHARPVAVLYLLHELSSSDHRAAERDWVAANAAIGATRALLYFAEAVGSLENWGPSPRTNNSSPRVSPHGVVLNVSIIGGNARDRAHRRMRIRVAGNDCEHQRDQQSAMRRGAAWG